MGSSTNLDVVLSVNTFGLGDQPVLEALTIISVPQVNMSVSAMARDRENVSGTVVRSLGSEDEDVLLSGDGSSLPGVVESPVILALEPGRNATVVRLSSQVSESVSLSHGVDESGGGNADLRSVVSVPGSNSELLDIRPVVRPEIGSLSSNSRRDVLSRAVSSVSDSVSTFLLG